MYKTSVYTLVNSNIKELAYRKQQKSLKVILFSSNLTHSQCDAGKKTLGFGVSELSFVWLAYFYSGRLSLGFLGSDTALYRTSIMFSAIGARTLKKNQWYRWYIIFILRICCLHSTAVWCAQDMIITLRSFCRKL